MSQIVLTTIGSLGDLHPIIAIGLGLRDRGHDIVFATIKDYRTWHHRAKTGKLYAKAESLSLSRFGALIFFDGAEY